MQGAGDTLKTAGNAGLPALPVATFRPPWGVVRAGGNEAPDTSIVYTRDRAIWSSLTIGSECCLEFITHTGDC